MTRLLSKNEVQQRRFAIRKKLHNYLKFFQNGPIFRKDSEGRIDFFTGFQDFLKKQVRIFKNFDFVSNFDELYLEKYLELEKNKICSEYLLLAKRSFPWSFHTSENIRVLYPLQT